MIRTKRTNEGRELRSALESRGGAGLHELVDGLYDDLRREAHRQLGSRPAHTLQPTALLNEALVRLLSNRDRAELNKGQLCTYIAKVMRSVLVDHARARSSAKRGGGSRSVPLDRVREPIYDDDGDTNVLAIHDALEVLARTEPEFAELCELRFFGHLSVQEVAATRSVPVSRVKVASQCLRRLLEDGR